MTTRENRRRIHFDEQTIAEHDKLRGTRMKIDEPDTPYAYNEYTASVPACEESVGKATVIPASQSNLKPKPPSAKISYERGDIDAKQSIMFGSSLNEKLVDVLNDKLAPVSSDPDQRKLTQHEDLVEKKKDSFKQHRKAHYNEFQRMQEFKRRLAAGEITDEEDDK
eukprot:g3144.t1